MISNGSRLRWVALPLFLVIGLMLVACGGGDEDEAGSLANLATGNCANQGDGTLILAEITDGPENELIVSRITEYLAEFGFSITTQVRTMTLAEAAAGIGNCSVHVVSGAPAGWTASGSSDYGVIYEDSSGPVHKYAVAQLEELTPSFAAALRLMELPMRRIEETAEWWTGEKRPWNRFEEDHERWAPAHPWKTAVFYYWEFDLTDGSWKAWLSGDFAPFDQIRKVTQAVVREIRGTPYNGEDQYEYFLDGESVLEMDDDGNIILDSRTMITPSGDLSWR